jgi:hypothetical protein
MTDDQVQKIDEYDVRAWFKTVEPSQAEDTFHVVEGILEARAMSQPKRKRRADAGQSRSPLSPDMKEAQKSFLRDASADRGADD